MKRCKYCKRRMRVSDRGYAENPFCQYCLHERLGIASQGRPIWAVIENGYARIVGFKGKQ